MRNWWLRMELTMQPGLLALSIDVEQRELAHLMAKNGYTPRNCARSLFQWADDFITRRDYHARRLDNVARIQDCWMNYLLGE